MNVNVVKNIWWLTVLIIAISFTGCTTVTPPPPSKVRKKLEAVEIPGSTEVAIYTVKRGDTVYRIAKAYGVAPEGLIKANRISDVRSLQPGQKIIIPGAEKTITYNPPPSSGKPSGDFIWPVRGKVISYYGDKKDGLKNTGIDIRAERGEDVVAVKGGVVLTTTEGFGGGVVVIEHWRGLDSWYGHVGEILVNKGSRVKQGQVIARVDNQPVLHFKIFVNDRPVDPLKYLR